jgi:hypothetical protein
LAHHFLPISVAVLLPSMLDAAFPGHDPLTWMAVICMPMFWIMLSVNRRHEAMLCERCAAEFPIDGDAQATHRLSTLRYHHHWQGWGVLLGFASWVGSIWVSQLWLVTVAWLLSSHHLEGVHRRLTLWCPWCRRGRGDDDPVDVTPPVPVASGDR